MDIITALRTWNDVGSFTVNSCVCYVIQRTVDIDLVLFLLLTTALNSQCFISII
jgi:hypothetical protein